MKKNKKLFLLLLFVLLIIVTLTSIGCGQVKIDFFDSIAILLNKIGMLRKDSVNFSKEQEAIMWFIRMPRTLVGLMAGAVLGISGAVMQGIFSNPLADPGIIGVSSGAATGAVVSIALGFASEGMFYMPFFAFCGSLLAVTITIFLAMKNGKIPVMTLLLAGVAVGMLLGALTTGLLTVLNEQKLQQYLFWMVGGLDYRRWEHVYLAIGPVVVGIGIMFCLARHLNVLVLGEVEAKGVGMAVMPFRMFLLVISAMTTAVVVCVSGNIGFVGLVIPHMMRMIIGPDHRYLLPASALGGAMFLVLCDILGRILMPPTEIRVGIMTAVLGSPYFLYLLRKMRGTF